MLEPDSMTVYIQRDPHSYNSATWYDGPDFLDPEHDEYRAGRRFQPNLLGSPHRSTLLARQDTLQDIESKSNLLSNDIKLLKLQVRQMKDGILARHDDIRKDLQPKIDVLQEYHESVTGEALALNEQAIDSLRRLRDFNQQCQEEVLRVSEKVNGLYRKIGTFS